MNSNIKIVKGLRQKYRGWKKRRRMMNLYRQFISKNELCFDIGANEGKWSEVFLALDATVIAVEPHFKSTELMRKKFRKNTGITILRSGVGSREEIRELKVAANQINSTFSDEFIKKYEHYEYLSWPLSEQVEVTTLDTLISHYGIPVFCKIDVEGYELEVFKGLSQPIKFIQFEYVPPFRMQVIQCIEVLGKLGKPSFNYYRYEDMVLQLGEWVGIEEMKKIVEEFSEDFLVGDILATF